MKDIMIGDSEMPKRHIWMRLSWLKKETIVETIAFLYVILFLYTGISKLMEYRIFKDQLSESLILKPVAFMIAPGLPLIEFIISLLLIIPRWRGKGLYASLILMVAFTIYIIAIMIFNKELPCSCGGLISLLSWPAHLVFNSVFIIFAFIGISLEKRGKHRLP
jgi:hypothetical protein